MHLFRVCRDLDLSSCMKNVKPLCLLEVVILVNYHQPAEQATGVEEVSHSSSNRSCSENGEACHAILIRMANT